MSYPENDTEFEDHRIKSVEKGPNGTYTITNESGWSLWCGRECPIVPEPGMTVRYYGGGLGSRVRGLFINGTKIWYRTKKEDAEWEKVITELTPSLTQADIELHGADAADWLARWDAGDSVWSIEMGGIGPGYEQCIQITAAEVLRWLLANKPDLKSKWASYDGEMGKAVNAVVAPLGLSGAQWAAAVNLAAHIYRQGPRGVMSDPAVADRKIKVSKNFPQLAS